MDLLACPYYSSDILDLLSQASVYQVGRSDSCGGSDNPDNFIHGIQ